ncbi:MAG TPA: response regulator [Candidatus Methylacidiphilales bacterium]|jgi:CheY-like chemotaxis protein|nr:response regulator [Candidatus Methylacidiphilales bacterium]
MHILLIDDSSSTRSLLRTLINSGQTVRHEISEAASGEEALQKVGSGEINLPDLIIMDINMGGMSGYELCREFRLRHGTPSDVVPYIIIVTANEGVDVINQALDSGANDYMPKPVNVKILQVRLRVAERLLAHAHSGVTTNVTGSGRVMIIPSAENKEVDPLQSLIASSIEYADAPITILEVAGAEPSFKIVYANSAMSSTTQYSQEQLTGKSLAELEAWTPEFLTMVLSFIQRGSIVSYVPLWSATRQAVPVHLSFYPIRAENDQIDHYLVIHHF